MQPTGAASTGGGILSGDNPAVPPTPGRASPRPVLYGSGEVILSSVDISSPGFGTNWSHTRTYSNQAAASGDYGQGYNWLVLNWPFAQQQGSPSSIAIVRGTQGTLWFDWNGTKFVGRYGTKSILTHDSVGQVYVLTFPDGSVNEFQDFTVASTLQGAFVRQLSPTGNVTEVTAYTPDGSIAQINQLGSEDGQPVTNAYLYQYENHRVTSVTLRRQRSRFGWEDILQAAYEYYEAGDDFGSDGDLKRMQRQFPVAAGWATGEIKYYRYYQAGDPNGFAHGLRYVVEPATYEKMVANGYDPLTVSNATIAMFADNYFEYDTQQRAVLEQVDGASQTFTFDYTAGTSSTDKNVWATKTVETLPDESQNIVYSNVLGLPLVQDFTSGTDHWINAFNYDDQGRLLWQATPSAVIGYDDAHSDLAINLRDHDGLISLTEYYTASGSGAAEGYVASRKIQQGASGDPITLATVEYLAQTVGSTAFYFVANQTAYRNDDSTGDIETSYDYTFYPGTAQIQQQTTTLPVVPTDQNGSGVAATRKTYFDIWNQPIWLTDERGTITRQAFDLATGGLVQRIDDVDTSIVLGAPTGWETLLGAGLNLVSDFVVDEVGRTVQSLGPVHQIDLNGVATTIRPAKWTVFEDVEHQLATGLGYQVIDSPEPYCELVNPVSLLVLDAGGKKLENIDSASTSTSGSLADVVSNAGGITSAFPQGTYVRLTTYQYTDCCLLESQRVYHTIPATGEGSPGTNYDQTDYGYDVMRRRNRIVTPGGTITDLVFDPRGLVMASYVGTNDDGATESDPTGGGTDPDNNMVLITANEYDNGGDSGDGNLTQQSLAVDTTVNRVTSMTYDFRNRRVTTDGEIDFFENQTYDNLNRIVIRQRYDTTASGNLIAQSATNFDNRGRVYQTIRYGVNPATGTVGNSLIDNNWYDAGDNLVKSLPSGSSLFTKTTFDSLGRLVAEYRGYDLDESTYADAFTVADDVILEQIETLYDDATNVIQETTRKRYHNAPDSQTGALRDPETVPKARVIYRATWPDPIGRITRSADYGTNGGTPLIRPVCTPARSDTVLIKTIVIGDAGLVLSAIDPMGAVTVLTYDDAGRRISKVENYVATSPSSSLSSSSSGAGSCSPSDDTNRTTNLSYTSDSLLATLEVINTSTGNQTTTYAYGTTLDDSDVSTSLLLRSIAYPGSVSGSDQVWYTYNRQAQRTGLTDQNGTAHQYDYDLLGRLSQDRIMTLGSGVDDAVLRLEQNYEVRGLIDRVTSFSSATVGSGTVVNETQWTYNSFSQSIQTYQSHSGAVNTSATPSVQVEYSDGYANTVRPTMLIYPNGRSVAYDYGPTAGIDDAVSRIASRIDDDLSSTHLADYSYLGLSDVVTQQSPEATLEYTLVSVTGTDDPITGDIYAGLDLFSRIRDIRWRNSASNTDLSRVQYGYNRASSRIWRENPSDPAQHYDWLYGNDGLQRVSTAERGTLNGTHTAITTLQFAQCWSLDSTGNWSGFQQDGTGGGTWSMVQARTTSPVNEITNITNTTGTTWADPEYDAVGNMTTEPQPADPAQSFAGKYDAWNRLVKLSDAITDDTVQENRYDGRNYRITMLSYTSGSLSETRHAYFTDDWQDIEERLGTDPENVDPDRQFVWGTQHYDALIVRDRSVSEILDERFYACQDATWDTTAIVDTLGATQERYEYAPYGSITFLSPTFVPQSASIYSWDTLYSGYQFDPGTEHFYVRNRYYNPTLGVWLTRDPIEYLAGFNLYAYVKNQAVTLTDAFGLLQLDGNGIPPAPSPYVPPPYVPPTSYPYIPPSPSPPDDGVPPSPGTEGWPGGPILSTVPTPPVVEPFVGPIQDNRFRNIPLPDVPTDPETLKFLEDLLNKGKSRPKVIPGWYYPAGEPYSEYCQSIGAKVCIPLPNCALQITIQGGYGNTTDGGRLGTGSIEIGPPEKSKSE
ncbi:MAG: RHS repeat-associated core domain-containing protein [Planctomycetes bacterium]|nr:RHS repeat-associated core domain-containing protein [Planctomycetota bacterium]